MINLSAEIIANGVTYEIRNLSSIEFSGQDRSDPSLPSWGIQSNSGSLEMYDNDGIIDDLNRKGVLAKAIVDIYLNFGNNSERIGRFYIDGVKKKGQNLLINLYFSDSIAGWQDKEMPEYYFPYTNISTTLLDILNALVEKSGIQLHFSGDTESWLGSIYISVPKIEQGSLWSQLNKICEVSSCYIYCDKNGEPNIYYGGDT